MKQSYDIMISGGGVAGLTAAAAFGTAGFSVLIVDPAPPITNELDKGSDLRTTAFLQPAQQFLAEAGIWNRLEAAASSLQVMRIIEGHGDAPEIRDFNAADISDRPFGWNIPNWVLRREMMARLEELETVTFRTGIGFESMLSRTSEARVRLTDGTKIVAKLVIAADGRDSPVRHSRGIGAKRETFGQHALTFAVSHREPHNDVSTEIHQSGGPFTLVPLPDKEGTHRSSVVWMTQTEHAQHLLALDTEEFEARATARSLEHLGRLSLVSPRGSWPIISQIADRLTAERTALVAEAAHVVPPIGAQGLNMSLKDLSCLLELATASRNDPGAPEVLDAYSRARTPDIRLRVSGVSLLNRTSIAGHPVLQAMRGAGISALHDIAPVRRSVMALGLGARS